MQDGDKRKLKFGFTTKQWEQLKDLLETGLLSEGSSDDSNLIWCPKLEGAFAKKMGSTKTISFNSCTSSIEAGLAALEVSRMNQVIVSPLTCYSSILPIMALGAIPVFCDIDYNTLTVSPKKFKQLINENTKALILPYIYGLPAPIKKFVRICESNEIKLIEDCSHVPGLKIGGKYAGTYGDVGCFSFAQSKILDCGEGGIAVTNNQKIADEMAHFKNGGHRAFRVYAPRGANYKMTEYTALLAYHQLTKLDKTIKIRKEIAGNYFETKTPSFIKPANNSNKCLHNVALFTSKKQSRPIVLSLRKNGLDAKRIYMPLNQSNVFNEKKLLFEALGRDKARVNIYKENFIPTPNANRAFEHYFYLEVFPHLSFSAQKNRLKIFSRTMGVL